MSSINPLINKNNNIKLNNFLLLDTIMKPKYDFIYQFTYLLKVFSEDKEKYVDITKIKYESNNIKIENITKEKINISTNVKIPYGYSIDIKDDLKIPTTTGKDIAIIPKNFKIVYGTIIPNGTIINSNGIVTIPRDLVIVKGTRIPENTYIPYNTPGYEGIYIPLGTVINKDASIQLSNNLKIHQNKIINNYLVPLCYLIYSFIYIKFNKLQLKKNIRQNNQLNEKMYSYFFNYDNPVIKNVNIYYYKRFLNEKNSIETSKKNTNLFLKNDIINEKQNIISSLNNIEDFVNTKINYIEESRIYDMINNEYEKIINIYLYNILKNLVESYDKLNNVTGIQSQEINEIKTKFNNILIISNTSTSIKNNYINKTNKLTELTNSKTSYKESTEFINNLINYLGKVENYEIYKLYEINFNSIISTVKDMIISINNINTNIIKLKKIDKLKILNYNELSTQNVIDNYKEFIILKNDIDNKKKYEIEIKGFIKLIRKNIESEIELYTEFFDYLLDTLEKNNKKNKKIENYNTEIDNLFENNLLNIHKLLQRLTCIQDSSKCSSIIQLGGANEIFMTNTNTIYTENSAKIITNLKEIQKYDNSNIEYLIQLYILSLSINFRIENKYIRFISKLSINDSSNDLNSTNISDIQFIFNKSFRNYKKNIIDNTFIYNNKLEDIKKLFEYEKAVTQTDKTKFSSNINKASNIANITTEINKIKDKIKKENEDYSQKSDKIDSIIKIYERINGKKEYFINQTYNKFINLNSGQPTTINNEADFKEIINKLLEEYKSKDIIYKSTNNKTKLEVIFKNNINDLLKDIFTTDEQNYINKLIKDKYSSTIKSTNTFYDKFMELYNILQKDKESHDTKITLLNNDMNKQQIKINDITRNKNFKTNKTEIDDTIIKNLDTLIENINSKLTPTNITSSSKINQNKNNENDFNKKIKDTINSYLDILISTSNKFDENILKLDENKSVNKLLFLYNLNNKQISEIYNNFFKSLDITKKEEIINSLNNYFNGKIGNDFINIIFINSNKQNNKEDIKSFFDIYKIYYNKLTKQIKKILNKINNNELKFNDIITYTTNFNNLINNKSDKINKIIYNTSSNKKNEKKGKVVHILPYTDILYAYILQLLYIIDYLTFFYN